MRNFITYEWPTIIVVLGIALIASAKSFNTLRFNDFLSIISKPKYLKIYAKEFKLIDPFINLLFLNFLIAFSLFLYIAYTKYFEILNFDVSLFLKILGLAAGFIIVKNSLERLLGYIFNLDDMVMFYLFQKVSLKSFSGLLFLFSNILLLYTPIDYTIIVVSSLIVFILIHSQAFFSSIKNYQKSIKSNPFYFLLYLCALEIAPYIVLYKAIMEFNF